MTKQSSGGGNGASQHSSNSLLHTPEAPINWQALPGSGSYEKPLLCLSLNTALPLLVGLERSPKTKVKLFLHHDTTHGLSLLWYSNLQEEVEDIRDLRRTQISPLVKELRYIYWDEDFEKWDEVAEPMDGDGEDEYLLPRYLKLVFEYHRNARNACWRFRSQCKAPCSSKL